MKYLLIIITIFTGCQDNAAFSGSNDENELPSINYTVTLDNTGYSHLVVFLNTIDGLEPGDKIGVFDLNGVLETVDAPNDVQYGEVLVAVATWNEGANQEGTVTEASAILSEDLSSFNGPVLNGAIEGNPIIIKIYDISEDLEYNTTPTFGVGGEFGDLFTTVTALLIEE